MEYSDGYETVKQKLIIAGITEIETHGITDFSLRRVAGACNVSCAAPYKHFKSKEDFIDAIVAYIHQKWQLLQQQIASVYDNDVKKQLIETCVAYIRFWIANPNFRSVLMLKKADYNVEHSTMIDNIAKETDALVEKCCETYGIEQSDKSRKHFLIKAIVYGATIMLDNGELQNEEATINMIRKCIDKEFV